MDAEFLLDIYNALRHRIAQEITWPPRKIATCDGW